MTEVAESVAQSATESSPEFGERQVATIARAARAASDRCGLRFSVFVGPSEGDPATFAARLLSGLDHDAAQSVVIHVDPLVSRVEIVTGRDAAARVDDRACRLAVQEMTPYFGSGDVVGGVTAGLRVLGDAVFWRGTASRTPAVG